MHPQEPQLTSPIGTDGVDSGVLKDTAKRLFGKEALGPTGRVSLAA